MTGNAKVRGWFETGHVAEAILGDGGYFIPDVDDPTAHDRLLVLGELLDWADERDRWQAAVRGIDDALGRSTGRHEEADAFDIADSLLTLADHGSWAGSIPWSQVRGRIAETFGRDHLDQRRASVVLGRLDQHLAEDLGSPN